ncbi:GntR family transcriptional regulator [Cetobacterium sp. 2G large]|uniref:GntR family transcriptional regulator n=1 Tax=Cetobacterium sp. 2G large TaxID=2759680 RepID=UPI00163C7906|nr:GntR family transcriptional regulator [Cetobacterium sp. 2G large]MBC2852584.1 GntR family transcriptional regulator [Cetobacterium sp. 2G large]
MKSLKDKAYDELKELIISGKLEANERIDEDFLSKSLNVSRTPVREAINRLEQEGWINIVPRKGMFVNNISLKEINDIFQVRSNLEPIILEMAFYKINREDLVSLKEKFLDFSNKNSLTPEEKKELDTLDNELHLLILRNCNNNFIIKMMENVYEHNMRIRNISSQPPIRRFDAIKEHINIIESILNDNLQNATEELKNHNLKAKEGFFHSLIEQ